MEKSKIISNCKVLILGGSAGSLDVLMKILPKLASITFAFVIVLHRKNVEDSTLEELIASKTSIPVKKVEDKTVLTSGNIYIAPADYHLLFEQNNLLSLDVSDKINYSRPSIDVAFESAAEIYKSNLVGILLSGANADGTEGLKAIKKGKGKIIVQKPESAEMPFMPNSAIENTSPDFILDIEDITNLIKSINM